MPHVVGQPYNPHTSENVRQCGELVSPFSACHFATTRRNYRVSRVSINAARLILPPLLCGLYGRGAPCDTAGGGVLCRHVSRAVNMFRSSRWGATRLRAAALSPLPACAPSPLTARNQLPYFYAPAARPRPCALTLFAFCYAPHMRTACDAFPRYLHSLSLAVVRSLRSRTLQRFPSPRARSLRSRALSGCRVVDLQSVGCRGCIHKSIIRRPQRGVRRNNQTSICSVMLACPR